MLKKITLIIGAFTLAWMPLFAQDYTLLEDKYAEEGVAASFKVGADWFPLPEYKDRAAWETLLDAGVRDSLVRAGEKYLDYKWQHIPASTYLAMNITGDKQAMRVIEMDNRTALISLMMAELAEGEGRFMMALADALWFYGTSYHWSHSNQTHHVLPAYEHERVALGNVRLGATIPIMWHFFHEEIDKLDRDICLAVEASVKRIILDPFLDESLDAANWWLGTSGRTVNNWCPWCNHGVLVAFFLMEKDQSRLDKAVAKSVKSVDHWLKCISQDGCCDEGPTYWGQAVARFAEYLQLLSDASGGVYDVLPNEHFKRMASYISRAYCGRDAQGNDIVANFADANARTPMNSFRLWRVGRLFDVKELMDCGLYCTADMEKGRFVVPPLYSDEGYRIIEMARRYKDFSQQVGSLNCGDFAGTMASLRAGVPVCTWYPDVRQAFVHGNGGLFLAAKMGNNGESHNHNDIGSFVLYSDEVPLLIDPGVGVYTMDMAHGSTRYGIWSMRSDWHNCPSINGTLQHQGGSYCDRDVSFVPGAGRFSLRGDIGGAYGKGSACTSWKRCITLKQAGGADVLELEDAFALDSRTAPDVEHFVTVGEVEIKDREVLIRNSGKTLRIGFPESLTPSVDEMVIEDEHLRKNWGGSVRRVCFTSAADAPLKGRYSFKLIVK